LRFGLSEETQKGRKKEEKNLQVNYLTDLLEIK